MRTWNFIHQNSRRLNNRPVNLFYAIWFVLLTMSPSTVYASFFGVTLNGFANAGYGRAHVAGESQSPNMGQLTLGIDYGIRIGFLLLGGTSDYRVINQYSSDEPNIYGNRRGRRAVLFSPTVGLAFSRWNIRYDYQYLGDYQLSQVNNAQQNITYVKPKGHRLQIRYRLNGTEVDSENSSFFLGLFAERVTYTQEKIGSQPPQSTKGKLYLDQAGITFGWGF